MEELAGATRRRRRILLCRILFRKKLSNDCRLMVSRTEKYNVNIILGRKRYADMVKKVKKDTNLQDMGEM